MGKLLSRWVARFQQVQPGVHFENRMYGTASAIGALSLGAGDIALLGEEISPAAAVEFQRARGYAPTEIQVATGSLDVNFFDYAHMIFVHRDNPLGQLTLAQLEAIFGTERKRGAGQVRTWGDLGLKGEWANRPIQPYGWKVDEDFALFFRERVLGDSHRWNPAIREYVHVTRPDGSQYDHGQQILDALSADRYGIAISNVRYATPEVRTVALAWRPGEQAVQATRATLIAQQFPLVRIIPAYIDRAPGRPVAPAVREFVRFMLSREGQQALIEETGYLPISPLVNGRQMMELDAGESSDAAAQAAAPVATDAKPAFTLQTLPPIRSHAAVTQVIRLRGSASLRPLVEEWAAAFMQENPEVRVEAAMDGSDVGMAALYTGQADLALLGREAAAQELKAFEWIFRYRPAHVEILTGGTDQPGSAPALVFYVHRDNPLTQLSLAQADAVFGPERRRGAASALRTWGDLGLTGPWAAQPIRLYSPDTESGTGRFFRAAVLGDSRKLYWERLTEFTDESAVVRPTHDASRKIAAALAADRYGLAVAGMQPGAGEIKPLAILSDGMAVAPTAETIASRRYPLARPIYAYFNRAPGESPDPVLAGFLRWVLSRRDRPPAGAGLCPLPPEIAAVQQRQLE
ncbi:MAG: substrate-binding domain-containing protein [Opitutaceae bacterium]|nr:substrate-binding domain-containing protein [Opitutaceae bacterium]